MDLDNPLLHTCTVMCDLSGSPHVLVVTRNPELLGTNDSPLEVATIDGAPVEVLEDAAGRTYYRDPQTGKTYREPP